MLGIYKITSPTDSVYIGQSVDIRNRWGQHRTVFNTTRISKSISTLGASCHKFEILHVLPTDVSEEILDTYEQVYIDLYRSAGIELLNSREAGKHGAESQEHRSKISEKLKGRVHTKEHRQKNSESKQGVKCYMYGIESSKHPQAKKIINTVSKQTFGSIKEAAASIGIKRTTLSMMLIGKNPNKTNLTYDS